MSLHHIALCDHCSVSREGQPCGFSPPSVQHREHVLLLITVSFLSPHQKLTAAEEKEKSRTVKRRSDPTEMLGLQLTPDERILENTALIQSLQLFSFRDHVSHESTKLKINKIWLSFYLV